MSDYELNQEHGDIEEPEPGLVERHGFKFCKHSTGRYNCDCSDSGKCEYMHGFYSCHNFELPFLQKREKEIPSWLREKIEERLMRLEYVQSYPRTSALKWVLSLTPEDKE